MAGQPIDKSKTLRGQEYYWSVIRTLGADGGRFTVSAVADETNGEREVVREYMRRLEKARYIERAGRRENDSAVLYTIAKDSRFAPRVRRDGSLVPPTKQDHMWRAIKMLKRFTLGDLAAAASTEEVTVSEVHAADYLKHLANAGYVRRVGTSPVAYTLLPDKNTGPRAPYIQRVKQVFDPNLNKVVWRSDGGDE